MRVKMLAVPVAMDDFDKLYKAADIFERQQTRPRSKVSVRDFILESALERADQIISKNNRVTAALRTAVSGEAQDV